MYLFYTFIIIYNIIYLFYLWLHWVFICMPGLSLVVVSGGCLLAAVRGLLVSVTSFIVEHTL